MVYDTYSASIKVFADRNSNVSQGTEVSVEGGSIYSMNPKGKAGLLIWH